MKLRTFLSNDPVFSPEKLSVEKKKMADIQTTGGHQYFRVLESDVRALASSADSVLSIILFCT
jgi:hypothetical protein